MSDSHATKQGLLILGTGSQGRIEADLAEACGWSNIAFAHDDFPSLKKTDDWDVVGTFDDLAELKTKFPYATAGFGNNQRRLEFSQRLMNLGFQLPVLCHPNATISPRAVLGAGTIVMPGVVVNIGAKTGKATILNTGCTIDHDCNLGDGVHISPGVNLAGTVHVGAQSWIGVGASIKNNITIGKNCTIGAGAVVIRDVPDGETVVGVPAKPIQKGRSIE